MKFGNLTGNWSRNQTQWFDAIFATVMIVLSFVGLFTGEVTGSEKSWDWLAVVLVLGHSLPLFFRRSHPLTTLNIVLSFMMAFWVLDYTSNFDAQLLFAMYAATAFGVDRRKTWINVSIVMAITTIVALVGVYIADEDLPLSAVFALALLHSMGAIFGQTRYDRHRRLIALERRAEQAEAELEIRTHLAVVDERTRIAREMHDVVSHSMSVMVVQASAAQRILATDPDAAKEALGHIETTGRESLVEMRRMLGVLRDGSVTKAELTPQPDVADFEALKQHCNDAGITTSISTTGEQVSLSPGLRLASYRVAQEALTNVIKHAGRPARAEVLIDYGPDALTIRISDNGMGAAAALNSEDGGHGLIGMLERVALYDGTFNAGPQDGGGFLVTARFPYGDASGQPLAADQPRHPTIETDQPV